MTFRRSRKQLKKKTKGKHSIRRKTRRHSNVMRGGGNFYKCYDIAPPNSISSPQEIACDDNSRELTDPDIINFIIVTNFHDTEPRLRATRIRASKTQTCVNLLAAVMHTGITKGSHVRSASALNLKPSSEAVNNNPDFVEGWTLLGGYMGQLKLGEVFTGPTDTQANALDPVPYYILYARPDKGATASVPSTQPPPSSSMFTSGPPRPPGPSGPANLGQPPGGWLAFSRTNNAGGIKPPPLPSQSISALRAKMNAASANYGFGSSSGFGSSTVGFGARSPGLVRAVASSYIPPSSPTQPSLLVSSSPVSQVPPPPVLQRSVAVSYTPSSPNSPGPATPTAPRPVLGARRPVRSFARQMAGPWVSHNVPNSQAATSSQPAASNASQPAAAAAQPTTPISMRDAQF